MNDAIIISDLHLGSYISCTEHIQRFLASLPKTKRLIMNGDILDSTQNLLDEQNWHILNMLTKLSKEIELVWIAGNHDYDAELIAYMIGASFQYRYMFMSGGKTITCVHGDEFDGIISKYPRLAKFSDRCYRSLQYLCPGLARMVKRTSKIFLRNSKQVRNEAITYGASHGYDIVCCGHTHIEDNLCDEYYNSGCWTDNNCHYLRVNNGNVYLEKLGVLIDE